MGNPVAEGRRALVRNMWNERIKGAKRNVEVNFRTSLSERVAFWLYKHDFLYFQSGNA